MAIEDASRAQITADSAQTKADNALSKASDWQILYIPINTLGNNPDKIFIGNQTAKNISSSETYETLDGTSLDGVFSINAGTVVKSSINSAAEIDYQINFLDTLKRIDINNVYNPQHFEFHYEFKDLHMISNSKYATISMPLQFPFNSKDDELFYNNNILRIGSLPVSINYYYCDSSHTTLANTIVNDIVDIVFSIGRYNDNPVILITIPLIPKQNYSSDELISMYLYYFRLESL